jgi:hypothetical protein
MHVARQRVFATPQTLARPKVLDLKIKSNSVRFGICFEKKVKKNIPMVELSSETLPTTVQILVVAPFF